MDQRVDINIGGVTAYAYAVSKGFTGTEEEFAALMANIGNTQKEIEDAIDEFVNTTVPGAVQQVETTAEAAQAAAAASATAAASSETNAAGSATEAGNSASAAEAARVAAVAAQAAAEAAAASIVVDDELSETSEHPVQNKVITKEVNDIWATLRAASDDLYRLMLENGQDYFTVMRSFFTANGANAMVDLTALCERWYTLSRIGWTGGVRFAIPRAGVTESSDGTKTGDNAGMVCVPSTTVAANRDDYANKPLFAVTDCNVSVDSDGNPHILAIDLSGIGPTFARSDPSKIVCCMQMTGWLKNVLDTENSLFGFDYSDETNADGFQPLPEAVSLLDNSVRAFVVHCKYPFGDGYSCCSGQKTLVWSVSYNAQLSGVRNAWGSQYCGVTSADDAFMKRMLYLKYGQMDSDRVLHGCCQYNYIYQLAAAETGVERILLTPAQAATLIVGSCICVGTSTERSGSKANDTALLDRVLITAIETVEIGGVSYGAVTVDNGGVTFDTATTFYMYTYHWHTGTTDNVLGNDGGIAPTDSRYPVKLQGIEYMVGCYECIGDTILKFQSIDGVACEVANICRDSAKLTGSVSSDYQTCSYGTPLPSTNMWQWPKRLGFDDNLPEILYPSIVGASSTSGTRDGSYNEAEGASGLREWLRFGSLGYGLANAGLSCVIGNYGLGNAIWAIGGRLSVSGKRGEFQAAA